MAINLSDLPPKYQQQAVEKYMKQQKRRGPAPPGPFSALTVKKRPGDMTT